MSGAAAAQAQQSIRPVSLTPFADGQDFVLMADLVYQIGATSHVIVVPAGFVTDFGSTPRSHLVGATAPLGERGKRLSRR